MVRRQAVLAVAVPPGGAASGDGFLRGEVGLPEIELNVAEVGLVLHGLFELADRLVVALLIVQQGATGTTGTTGATGFTGSTGATGASGNTTSGSYDCPAPPKVSGASALR